LLLLMLELCFYVFQCFIHLLSLFYRFCFVLFCFSLYILQQPTNNVTKNIKLPTIIRLFNFLERERKKEREKESHLFCHTIILYTSLIYVSSYVAHTILGNLLWCTWCYQWSLVTHSLIYKVYVKASHRIRDGLTMCL